MGILDMLMGGGGGANGFQQMIGYGAPAKSGMGGLGGGSLQGFLKQGNVQDLLKQLMQSPSAPQGGAQGGGSAPQPGTPQQPGMQSGGLPDLIAQYLQQQRR